LLAIRIDLPLRLKERKIGKKKKWARLPVEEETTYTRQYSSDDEYVQAFRV
jgi:hypothetical protein